MSRSAPIHQLTASTIDLVDLSAESWFGGVPVTPILHAYRAGRRTNCIDWLRARASNLPNEQLVLAHKADAEASKATEELVKAIRGMGLPTTATTALLSILKPEAGERIGSRTRGGDTTGAKSSAWGASDTCLQ
jgi:hypothetical protein